MRKSIRHRSKASEFGFRGLRLPVLLILTCFLTIELHDQITKSSVFWKAPTVGPAIPHVDIDHVDLSPLWGRAHERSDDLAEQELRKFVQSNFRFLLYNKLNRDNFLEDPGADFFVEKIVGVSDLSDRLSLLIEEGQRMAKTAKKLVQFRHCLSKLNYVNASLTRELDHYFFSLAPGLVMLSEYRANSIGVLCELLVKLSVLTKQVLRN